MGTLKAVARHFMSSLTTAAIPQELQRDALLTLEQLTTSITVLALHASNRPVDTPRVRANLGNCWTRFASIVGDDAFVKYF